MSRLEAWNREAERQNIFRTKEGLPPFDANLPEYSLFMMGFYAGYDAVKKRAEQDREAEG